MKTKDASPKQARSEPEVFEDLQSLCNSPGFIHAIAYFCWRDNFTRYAGEQITNKDIEHHYSSKKLLRTEIGTLVGLLAKGSIDTNAPTPVALQGYIDKAEYLLNELHSSLVKPWLAAFGSLVQNSNGPVSTDLFNGAEGFREPIFYSGESAHSFQYQELAFKKYAADDEWLKSRKKFSIEEACKVVDEIGKLQERRVLELTNQMRNTHPNDWTFLPGFSFAAHELKVPTGLPLDSIEQILAAFTANLANKNTGFSSLNAFNETNAAPLIKRSDNTYLLLQHYSLLEALYESPFFWMAADKSYSALASKHRGEFTEGFLTTRLLRVFGPQHVYRNVDIYKGKARYAEADALVIFGDYAIIIQAKSKRLTIEARKGNDGQLKDDFKKAVQDAYDQALLCSNALLQDEFRFVLQSGDKWNLTKKPKKIFTICAVSDHFPALTAQARRFLKTSATETVLPPMVVDVFFLDVLTEILETPLQFLNYLYLRAKFDKQVLVNQEYAALGYHLTHNLWLDEEYDTVNLGDDFCGPLDIAMYARRIGVQGERTPKGILTRYNGTPIGRLISEIEVNPFPELVGLGILMLQISSKTAKQINAGISKLMIAAATDGRSHDMSVPVAGTKSGFTIHVSSLPITVARDQLFTHCKIKKYEMKADVWYGVIADPQTAAIRGSFLMEESWRPNNQMENILAALPKRPMLPIATKVQTSMATKVGRNEPCPCGSGNKFKKCCLANS